LGSVAYDRCLSDENPHICAQDHLQRPPAGERIKARKLPDEFKGQRGAIDLTTTHEFR
jgi:hypothetical protein